MSEGKSLNDNDRKPWLISMNERIAKTEDPCVLGCSALKKKYRELLVKGIDPKKYLFLFLDVSKDVVKQRLGKRKDHFFNQKLVDSQFDTLERPNNEDRVIIVDGNKKFEEVVDSCIRIFKKLEVQ